MNPRIKVSLKKKLEVVVKYAKEEGITRLEWEEIQNMLAYTDQQLFNLIANTKTLTELFDVKVNEHFDIQDDILHKDCYFDKDFNLKICGTFFDVKDYYKKEILSGKAKIIKHKEIHNV